MRISNTIHTKPKPENTATIETATTPVELHGTGTLEPQVSPNLRPETQQLQVQWQAQSPEPILASIRTMVVDQPPAELQVFYLARSTLPGRPDASTQMPPHTSTPTPPLTASQLAITKRVHTDAKKFEGLWELGQWSAAHEVLKSLGRSYPRCNAAGNLTPELDAAHRAMEKLHDPVKGFLLASAHLFNQSPPSSPWKRTLRHQPTSACAASLERVVTHGPLGQPDATTFAKAIQGTMVRLSWLLPDWGMPAESQDERIQDALAKLFTRLGELHKAAKHAGEEDAFLRQILDAVTARYCSPALRATLDTFEAKPKWLKASLQERLRTIDREAGAELFPSRDWQPYKQKEGGTKRARDDVRPSDDEQAPRRPRTDEPAQMPPVPPPARQAERPQELLAAPESANPTDQEVLAFREELLQAVDSQDIGRVQAALARAGALTQEAVGRAYVMDVTLDDPVSTAILAMLNTAALRQYPPHPLTNPDQGPAAS